MAKSAKQMMDSAERKRKYFGAADHSNDRVKDRDTIIFNPNGGGADFVMHRNALTAWVTVGEISVHISKMDGLVKIELYPHYHEACCEPLAECQAEQSAKKEADKDHESGE